MQRRAVEFDGHHRHYPEGRLILQHGQHGAPIKLQGHFADRPISSRHHRGLGHFGEDVVELCRVLVLGRRRNDRNLSNSIELRGPGRANRMSIFMTMPIQ